jgi:hypothetical protein
MIRPRLVFALTVAFGLHFLVLAALRVAPAPIKNGVSEPVKIRIVAAPKPVPPQLPGAESLSTRPQTARKKKQTATSNKVTAPAVKQGAQNYLGLLPTVGEISLPVTGATIVAGEEHLHPSFQTQQLTHAVERNALAQAVSDRISVPYELFKIQASGRATIVLSKRKDWRYHKLDGDPYVRALLFDAFAEPDSEMRRLLAAAGIERNYTIIVEFRRATDLEENFPERTLIADLEQVRLQFVAKAVSDNWVMMAASPTGVPAVNILGVAWRVLQPIVEDPPESAPVLKKLRRSFGYSAQGAGTSK